MTSATMPDLLEIVTRSRRPFVVIRMPDTTIAAVNAPAEELFGEPAPALIGRHASSLFRGADEVHAAIALSALAAGAVDSYTSRRRLAGRADLEAWTCVRIFEVEGGFTALKTAAPVEQPRPLDSVEEELAHATDIQWLSPPLAAGSLEMAGRGDTLTPITESPYAVLDRLPLRKREIVAALLQGDRVPDIAASMFVSTSTIRSHLSIIFRAFGVRSQAGLLSLLRSRTSPAGRTGRAVVPPLGD
jgi:DNA-binding CsgD family transcriptional regulator